MSLGTNPIARDWLQQQVAGILDQYLDEQHAEMMLSSGPIRKWWESICYTQLKRQVQPFALSAAQQVLDQYGPMTVETILLSVIQRIKEKS